MIHCPEISFPKSFIVMLVEHDISKINDISISHSVTLVPRLNYSKSILDEIVEILKEKKNSIHKSNNSISNFFEDYSDSDIKAINLERKIVFSLEVLLQIQKITGGISGIISIPETLPVTIPMIRTISAQLYEIVPICSQKLSELSVHLGSIVLDSAILTKARFDFNQSNHESSEILDEVKLMVDSKISKQHPNLDFFKLSNT